MRRVLSVILVLAVVAACGSDDAAVRSNGPSASPSDLQGHDWRIEVVTDASGERREIDPTFDAVLRFDREGGFGAKTCNHTGGDATMLASTIEWGDEISSTSMACLDENLTWLEATVGTLFRGTSTWALTDGRLRIEGNGVAVELTERPAGFPTEMVQLATSDPSREAQWQLGYTEDPDAGANGGYRYFLQWEGRSAPGTGYGSAGMAVDPAVSLETMWLDDVDGELFPFGTLPVGTASAVFESTDGSREDLHLYELPDGRLVYGERVAAAKGQVVAFDAQGAEIGRGRVVPV
jgi:heat shock protein HslJ